MYNSFLDILSTEIILDYDFLFSSYMFTEESILRSAFKYQEQEAAAVAV